MVTDTVEVRHDGVVVEHGLLTLVFDLVGYLAGIDHLLHILDDEAGVLGDLLDDIDIVNIELGSLVGGEGG